MTFKPLVLAPPAAVGAYPAVLSALVPHIADEVAAYVHRRAVETMGSTRDAYLAGLEPVRHIAGPRLDGSVVAELALAGVLPNLVEHGSDGGSMSANLLAGSTERTRDGRRIARVPISGAGPVLPIGHEAPVSGLRVRRVSAQAARAHAAAAAPRAHSARPSLARPPTDGRQRRGPVRAVTDASSGFIHPGFEPADLFGEAQAHASEVTSRLLDHALDGAERGTTS